MFERFTDRARQVVVLAQEEARGLNHNYIGTEHLLLGLLHEGEGVAALVLEELGIRIDAARTGVEEIIGRSDKPAPAHLPFTPRAKKILELALRESLSIGHNYIGTEHILLGLIREGEGVAVKVIRDLGADVDRIRPTVLERIGNPRPRAKRKTGRRDRRVGSLQPDEPSCPTCGRDLASTARVRRLLLPTDDASEVEINVVYCGGCGRTLGTAPA